MPPAPAGAFPQTNYTQTFPSPVQGEVDDRPSGEGSTGASAPERFFLYFLSHSPFFLSPFFLSPFFLSPFYFLLSFISPPPLNLLDKISYNIQFYSNQPSTFYPYTCFIKKHPPQAASLCLRLPSEPFLPFHLPTFNFSPSPILSRPSLTSPP